MAGPRRILMTADTVGGVWTYAMELARALCAHGIEIGLATMGAPMSAYQRSEVAAICGLTAFESAFRLEWMEEPWDDVERAGRWLLQIEGEFRPDVVHLNGYAHGALPWRAPCLVVGHSCVLSWWSSVKREEAPDSWRPYRERVAAGLRAAQFVAAPTAAMLQTLQRYYGPLPETAVIWNGRNGISQQPVAKEPFVFSAGRVWDEAKNIRLLEQCAHSLEWPVYVAGDARHPSGATVKLTGLRMLGMLTPEQVAAWLARAAIYALPVRYEPFGLSALEAALCGCALVLGDVPSLRELWADAAIFVPDDAGALCHAIQTLICSPRLRGTLARKARQRACRFTPERMAEGYSRVYRRLAG